MPANGSYSVILQSPTPNAVHLAGSRLTINLLAAYWDDSARLWLKPARVRVELRVGGTLLGSLDSDRNDLASMFLLGFYSGEVRLPSASGSPKEVEVVAKADFAIPGKPAKSIEKSTKIQVVPNDWTASTWSPSPSTSVNSLSLLIDVPRTDDVFPLNTDVNVKGSSAKTNGNAYLVGSLVDADRRCIVDCVNIQGWISSPSMAFDFRLRTPAALVGAGSRHFVHVEAWEFTTGRKIDNAVRRRIVVGTPPQPPPPAGARGASSDEPPRINVNRASLEQLQLLPGVGPALAQAIVDARPHKSLASLLDVQGMGLQKLSVIEPFIIVKKPS